LGDLRFSDRTFSHGLSRGQAVTAIRERFIRRVPWRWMRLLSGGGILGQSLRKGNARLRHLPKFGARQLLQVKLGPRNRLVECQADGLTRRVEIPLANPRRSDTRRFERSALELENGAAVFVGDSKGADALKPVWKRLRGSQAKIEAAASHPQPMTND
jgi:hypothetical protein